MKKSILFTLLSILVLSFSVSAQNAEFNSSRLNNSTNRLKQLTLDLSDRTSERLRGNSITRADIEEAFLATQLDASANLFERMIGDNRRIAELRDAAVFLNDLARRIPTYGANSYLWRDVQTSVNEINRELGNRNGNNGGNNSGNNNGNNNNSNSIIGRAFWRGTVDDKVQLVIQNQTMRVQTVSGKSYPDGTSSFTAALPTRKVAVGVNKQKGRGNVRVLQQPSRENDFTSVIEIYDEGSGAKEYQLEIFWQKD
ncbi:MAG: hypothetical protein M3Q99_17400 [Acidobacteriota bacterium]|nr:hypothetical protein [Acidobacteriota bacterium]